MCEDDGGTETPTDGGMQPGGAGGMSGRAGIGGTAGRGGSGGGGGSGAQADACSCHARIDDEKQGRIDVCTQGETRPACARFSCERGTVSDELCPETGVRMCCVMTARGLVSVLYGDCTHPNCVAGFSQQCDDFGGELHGPDCESLVRASDAADDDGEGNGCAVAAGARGGDLAAVGLALLALWRGMRVRRSRDPLRG